ncbi:MAG: hypothetical protein NT124_03415 [Candidatus Dependentiae bacterium]|nr:hypothetical protein [Candidatus Dependentiae bacterium]
MNKKIQTQAEKLHNQLNNTVEQIHELKKELGEYTKNSDSDNCNSGNGNDTNGNKGGQKK